jgi:hypothetical protein
MAAHPVNPMGSRRVSISICWLGAGSVADPRGASKFGMAESEYLHTFDDNISKDCQDLVVAQQTADEPDRWRACPCCVGGYISRRLRIASCWRTNLAPVFRRREPTAPIQTNATPYRHRNLRLFKSLCLISPYDAGGGSPSTRLNLPRRPTPTLMLRLLSPRGIRCAHLRQ